MMRLEFGKMGNFFAVALSVALLAGCTAPNNSSEKTTAAQSASEPIKIGIIQLVEHQSLDAIYQGIMDEFAENGYVDGKNITVDYQNGQGDQSNLKTISQRFVNNQEDLIIAIATGAAQAAAAETDSIPIVASSVTDMVSAALVESNDAPGGNVTGVSDMTPVKEQLDILLQLVPDAKNIGLAYCSSEVNSEVQANLAKEYIESKGLTCVPTTVVSVNDIPQALESIADKVDALYIPVDNTFASAMPSVMGVCEPQKLPVVVGAAAMVEEGALASVAFDYYDAGRQSAKMAIEILNGAEPAATPVELVKDTHVYLNKTYAEKIGITIPEEMLKNAAEVY